MLALALTIPSASCTGGSASPEAIDPCDTEGAAQATSGGDHGPPWQGIPDPFADDTAAPKLDLEQYDFSLPDIPPPGVTEWQDDPGSGIQYRRPTALELERNRWAGNLLLVALEDTFVARISSAAREVTLSLPLADVERGSLQDDLPVISVPLVHLSTRDFAGVVEHRVTARGATVITARRPVFHSYIQEDLDWGTVDDVAVHVFAQDDGGIVASGATYGRSFWLEGPYEDHGELITIDLEPEPGRTVYLLHTRHGSPLGRMQLDEDEVALHVENRRLSRPEPSLVARPEPAHGGMPGAINQCTDGLNNDPDLNDVADGCDYSCMPHPDFGTDLYPGVAPIFEYARPFAVVGSAEWCSTHPDNWQGLLHSFGRTAEEMLNWVEAPPALYPGPRVPPFRLVGEYCWVLEDLDAALECHYDGICPPGYESYPFAGVGDDWSSPSTVPTATYLDRVWGAADDWAADGVAKGEPGTIHPLQNIVVVVSRQDPTETEEIGGKAFFHNAQVWRVGAGIALGTETIEDGFGNPVDMEDMPPILIGRIIAHEIGHTHGLKHDATVTEGLPNFMSVGGGPSPILGDDVESEVIKTNTNPPEYFSHYEAWTQTAPMKFFPRPPGFSYVGCTVAPDNCPVGLQCTDTDRGFECI